ncbi:hypothetical protein [Petrachloros mirabilis]
MVVGVVGEKTVMVPIPRRAVVKYHKWNMALRWKLLVVLGAVFITLALSVDWPPPGESGLRETKSFLLFLGVVVGVAGLIVGFFRE